MYLAVIGLSHKTAPLPLRERVAMVPEDIGASVQAFDRIEAVREAVVVSTCNRTEVYVLSERWHDLRAALIECLAGETGVEADEFQSSLYFLSGEAAVRHLYRVTSGLDSMVLGETEILRQVKDAYRTAREKGTVGKVFHTLFQSAFETAKQVRTETSISESAVSLSYAAVELAGKIFESWNERTVLVVGAGKMSRLTVRHLLAQGAGRVLVANRSLDRAQELADRVGGQAVALSRLEEVIAQADVIISCTGSPDVVMTASTVRQALSRRPGRSLFVADLAVPRDVEESAGQLPNVFLYNLDDLETAVSANLERRARASEKAERIIDEAVADFSGWLETLEVVPLIKSLRGKAEAIRQREVAKAMKMLPDGDETTEAVVDALTRSIVNKLLNDPTVRIKEVAQGSGDETGTYVSAVSELFDLELDPAETVEWTGLRGQLVDLNRQRGSETSETDQHGTEPDTGGPVDGLAVGSSS